MKVNVKVVLRGVVGRCGALCCAALHCIGVKGRARLGLRSGFGVMLE